MRTSMEKSYAWMAPCDSRLSSDRIFDLWGLSMVRRGRHGGGRLDVYRHYDPPDDHEKGESAAEDP
jgi:hypothetical protein